MRGITLVVHGEAGVGKSWLADTAPAPRLIMDAEGGSEWTPSEPKVLWDPQATPPPPDAETVIVYTRDFATVDRVYQWLNSGQHPFNSVTWDSLTEIQKRCMDQIVGANQLRKQDWGTLLRFMEGTLRQFRDLKMHPVRPLQAEVFIALSNDRGENMPKTRPAVQGSLTTTLPGYVDVVGYLYLEADENGVSHRWLQIQPWNNVVAKDRTHLLTQTYGWRIEDPNITHMLQVLNPTPDGSGA